MINKSNLMKRAWEIAKGRKIAIKFGMRLAWAEVLVDVRKDAFFASLSKENIKAKAFDIFGSEYNPAGAWWKECEKRGVEDSLKRYGYGIIKGAEERRAMKEAYESQFEDKIAPLLGY